MQLIVLLITFLTLEAHLFKFPSSFGHKNPLLSYQVVLVSRCYGRNMLVTCWLIVHFTFFVNNRSDVARSKGTGTPMTQAFLLLPCLPRVYFKHTHTHKWTFWESPCFLLCDLASVATFWLQSRGLWLLGWHALALLPAADQLCDLEQVT